MKTTDKNVSKYKNKVITIPNILSLVRLCLIPIIVWFYRCKQDYFGTLMILVLSGVSDILDGIIARHFGMISDVGKVLDPIADKLTQVTMLICLVARFPSMIILVIILFVKEITAAVMGFFTIKKTNIVKGAVWHGKLNTVLLYLMMIVHLIWFDIPIVLSNTLIVICSIMMLVSAVLYGIQNIKMLTKKKV